MVRRRALWSIWLALLLIISGLVPLTAPALISTGLGSNSGRTPVAATYTYDGVQQLSARPYQPTQPVPERATNRNTAAAAYAGLTGGAVTGFAAEDSGVIYRTGSRTENALRDSSGVSFRDSVSSSTSAEYPQVFRPGDKIWAVDTAKLPPGSVVRDGMPAGHVSVFATPEEINAAVIEDELLTDLGLKPLDEFGSFRIPK